MNHSHIVDSFISSKSCWEEKLVKSVICLLQAGKNYKCTSTHMDAYMLTHTKTHDGRWKKWAFSHSICKYTTSEHTVPQIVHTYAGWELLFPSWSSMRRILTMTHCQEVQPCLTTYVSHCDLFLEYNAEMNFRQEHKAVYTSSHV